MTESVHKSKLTTGGSHFGELLVAILVIIRRTKPLFELGPEFDKINSYMIIIVCLTKPIFQLGWEFDGSNP